MADAAISPPAGYTVDPVTPDVTPPAGYVLDQPGNVYQYTTETGIPVYKPAAPGFATPAIVPQPQPSAPPGPSPSIMRQALEETILNPAKQVGSTFEQAAANANLLTANLFHMLDQGAHGIASLTGTGKLETFKQIEDWARARQQEEQQAAAGLAGGREDLPSQIFRLPGNIAFNMPAYAVAAELGGPVWGMAGMGGLGALDQGWKAALESAAEGALLGKGMAILGPAGRVIRIFGNAAMTYADQRLHGATHEQALTNALGMGALGGIAPGGGTLREDLSTMAQGAAQLPENLPRPRLLPAVKPEASAAAQEVIAQGRKYNVPLTAGDITQAPSLKNIEVSAEQVPGLGMRKFREGQQEAAKTAATALAGKYEEALLDTDPSSITELQEAAGAGDERARNVLEKMNAAGNDPSRIIQASIGLGDWTTRQTATNLYDRVQQLAEQHNLGDVPLDSTTKAINGSLRQLTPAKLPNKEVIGLLQNIGKSIKPPVDAEGNPMLDEQGRSIPANNTYALIRQLHSDLGDRIREYYQGNNALIGEKGVGHLERVQNALEDDMRNYAAKSGVPEIVDAGEKADSYYKTARVPYKNGMLAAAATSTEPDSIFQQFIKAGKGDRAKNFYDALDSRGRAAVRYSMVAKAIEDATNPQSGIFSPQKFFTAVDKLEKAYDVFFTAKDKAEIQGFKNLMGHVTRAGQYAENPPTGQRAIPFILGGLGYGAAVNAAAHPLLTGGGAALFGMTRALLTTGRGRQWLMRAYGVKPGSPMMNDIWQHVAEEMPRPPSPPEGPPEGPGTPPSTPPGGGSPPGGGGGAAPTGSAEGAAPETAGGTEPSAGTGSLQQRLQTLGDEALDRVRKSGTFQGRTLPSLFPAEVTKDMATWGAARIANGAIDFAKWSKAMLDDAASISPEAVAKVRAMLPQLYNDSRKEYEHHAQTLGAQNIADLPTIMKYYRAGKEGKNWYNFVRPALQPLFGAQTDLFLKMFAATSPNTKVTQNVLNAVKAYRQFLLGEPFTGMPAHVDNLNRAVAGVKMSGPKVGAFGPNLLGDLNPVTVDLWMARAILGRDTVTPLQSKLVDYMTSQAALKAGLKPAEMQAAIWTGIKKLQKSRDTSAPPEVVINEYLDKNPDIRKLFEDSMEMSKEHFAELQSKQAPAKPPRT